MKRARLAVPLVAAGLAACTDTVAPPTAPPPETIHDVSAATFNLRAGLVLAVDDARSRVIPALGSSGAIRGVDQTFAVLADAVRSGDTGAVRDAIDGARGTLNALEHTAPGTSPVEVAALRLVLLNADVLFPAA
ncbi:MAG TPA: hypothetical protein VFR37_08065 [Longimicrobium sp.]|nr:hypothetical protein [Longimicrobium sp.]